ncbi:MAG: hypothetical protein HRT81_15870 [Henriciella sp.]|nr:hypothetical protein [Henriciella sp.]
MQSFFTVFIAGILAFIGVMLMSPEPQEQADAYIDMVSLEATPDVPMVPVVVEEPIQPLVLALDAYPYLDGSMDLPADVLLSLNE